MNFFQSIVENPNASAAVLTKKNVAWNAGLRGVYTNPAASKALKGRVSPPITEEGRAKISAMRKAAVGQRQHSLETRAKMSQSQKGRVFNDETRDKMSRVRSRPIMTPNGVYYGRRSIAEAAGVKYATVVSWFKRFPEHYYYLEA